MLHLPAETIRPLFVARPRHRRRTRRDYRAKYVPIGQELYVGSPTPAVNWRGGGMITSPPSAVNRKGIQQ